MTGLNKKRIALLFLIAALILYTIYKVTPPSPFYLVEFLFTVGLVIALTGFLAGLAVMSLRHERIETRVERLENHNRLFHKIPDESDDFDPTSMDTEPDSHPQTAKEAWIKNRGQTQ